MSDSSEFGYSGYSGESDDSGKSGDSGDSDDSGQFGDSGQYGDSGESGESGDSGEQGDSGESGDTGESGDSLESGDSCEYGDTGQCGDILVPSPIQIISHVWYFPYFPIIRLSELKCDQYSRYFHNRSPTAIRGLEILANLFASTFVYKTISGTDNNI